MRNSEATVLQFWRDVEVLNIPAAPKVRNKNDSKGRLELQLLTLEDDTPLPWVKGHRDYLESKEGDEWRHTVYIGIADMEKLAKLVIQEICPKGNLTKKDSQQLNGKGYMALFCVNGQGLIDSESYVPASFVLGLAQYQTDRHLFDIKKALREADDKFKERRKGQVITPAAPENNV